MAETYKLKIILGSTRPNRFSEKALPWVQQLVAQYPEFETEVLDLRDYEMPFFEEGVSPSVIKSVDEFKNETVRAWGHKIEEADAYLVIAPEYNHGYSAVLKNAFDSVYYPWNQKPIAFVSYGSVGGGRSVEQMREVAVELQMAPIRSAVHIQTPWTMLDSNGALSEGALKSYEDAAKTMLSQLSWWTKTLGYGRKNVAA